MGKMNEVKYRTAALLYARAFAEMCEAAIAAENQNTIELYKRIQAAKANISVIDPDVASEIAPQLEAIFRSGQR